MTNLLPHTEQKKMWASYRARFMIAGALALCFVAVVGAAALIPAYLVTTFTSTEESFAVERGGSDPVAIARAQALTTQLSNFFAATSSPTQTLLSVIEKRPANLTIDRITYVPGQITVGGAGNRDTVNAFRTALSADARFTSVAVPVAALVGSEGNRFSMTISGSF